jgi:NodT family efflux transporter outer membrane factor (OMF) lipoprotein
MNTSMRIVHEEPFQTHAPGSQRRPSSESPCPRCGSFRTFRFVAILMMAFAGCTGPAEYIANGFKVGPNYQRPPAPVAPHWIDETDSRVRSTEGDDSHWWTVFNDPKLNELVQIAYQQNLSVREAAFRVLQNRALLAGSIGNLFPQTQTMNGQYERINLSREVANRQAAPQIFYNQWNYGFSLAWELDFWGRFRRAIEAANDQLDASVENYDDVLVTLIGDVASAYVQIRTIQLQILYARQTLLLQRQSLEIATAKYKGGQTSIIDVDQGQSDVSASEALIEQQLIPLRQTANRLCVLLGIPAEDILAKLGEQAIPTAPADVVVGIPADLLRRRPDVRKAERLAAAQNAEIGVAIAALYPQISIGGDMGWEAQNFKDLFGGKAFQGVVGPSFNWAILNYGRLLSNIRAQDALFQEQVTVYQNTVLKAGQEVEDGLIAFLRARYRAEDQAEAVRTQGEALKEAIAQYKNGLVDYNRVIVIQEKLVDRQQVLADAQGQIAQGLIQVYRALGGGWQIRTSPDADLSGMLTPPANPPTLPEAGALITGKATAR